MKANYLIVLSILAAPALANEPEHKLTSQQSRMAACSHETRGMKSDERHQFMSECLKGHKQLAAKSDSPQLAERHRSCSAEATRKELHGDERRAFVDVCMKG